MFSDLFPRGFSDAADLFIRDWCVRWYFGFSSAVAYKLVRPFVSYRVHVDSSTPPPHLGWSQVGKPQHGWLPFGWVGVRLKKEDAPFRFHHPL